MRLCSKSTGASFVRRCARNEGVEVDTQGDVFFIAFCALAGCGRYGSWRPRRRLDVPVRMGIHAGASRNEPPRATSGSTCTAQPGSAAAGHGGQVVVSDTAACLFVDVDGLLDLGEHRLKDFDEPARLYQLGHDSFPPLRTISNL